MSNIEKAAKVIGRWTKEGHELNSAVGSPHAIAERIADAGLLAPDLPEPGRAWNDDEAPLMWKITDDFNSLAVVIEERLPETPVQLETFNQIVKRLTIEQARRAAHALLAAANYSEGKKQ